MRAIDIKWPNHVALLVLFETYVDNNDKECETKKGLQIEAETNV